jgi:hypothetical protein
MCPRFNVHELIGPERPVLDAGDGEGQLAFFVIGGVRRVGCNRSPPHLASNQFAPLVRADPCRLATPAWWCLHLEDPVPAMAKA